MALIVERGWETITIQDIADRANVNRATFYLHYRDKDELLIQGMVELYQDIIDRHPGIARHDQSTTLTLDDMADTADFDHIAEHADFYRTMLSDRGSAAFIVMVTDFLSEVMQRDGYELMKPPGVEPEVPLDVIAAFTAGAEIGLVRYWLTRGQHHSAADMARMMAKLCMFGTMWALKAPIQHTPGSADRPTPTEPSGQ